MKESKKKSKPSTNNNKEVMAPAKAEAPTAGGKIWDDARFAHLVSDPRFRGIPKSQKKVQIDSRFKSMFKDERFNVKAKVDKYGRKLRPTETAELRKFYELEDEDDDTDAEEQEREREREQRAMEGRADTPEQESEAESDSSDELQLTKEEKGAVLSEKVKNRLRTFADDFRRGEGRLHSDDSSEDSSSDDDDDEQEEEDEVFIEHVWGELDADAEHTEESSHRLAVCHMDWDRIRAVDIMVLLTSFLPPGSSVKSVKIYPSEFGKERMKEEEERGPQELTVRRDDSEEEEEDDEESQKERLREYQLNRLKYYYAVAECDSVETADKIYKECDGVEYESTANKIDLRFIPDDMEFGDDEPKDSCTELPDMGKYVPRIFNTSALQQAKVELTWDENDLERKEFNEKLRDGKWAQMPETELKKYVACSSSDEDETRASGKKRQKRSILRLRAPEPDDEDEDSDDAGALGGKEKQNMIAKYKALLSDIKEQEQATEEDQIGMEFTWKVNGDDGAENEGQSSGTDHRKPPLADDVNPFEKILQKKKEKSKRRKELKKRRKRGELVEGSDGEQSGAGSSSDSEDDLPYGVDLNDPFFASAFDEKEFGGPKQKGKKKDPEALRQTKEREEREEAEEARRQAELELLLDDGDDSRAHFNLRAIQEREIDLKTVSKSKRRRLLKKSKREIEEQRSARGVPNGGDNFEVDLEDTRFGAIYSKAEYNIDPTNPSFKKTKGMERLIDHKLKKRQLAENDARDDGEQRGAAKKQRKDVATTMLVKSIKRKIGQGT